MGEGPVWSEEANWPGREQASVGPSPGVQESLEQGEGRGPRSTPRTRWEGHRERGVVGLRAREGAETPLMLLGSFLEPILCYLPLQANETFAFVGNVTHYAQVWLNISAEIRSFLEQGRLQQHLRWLQQVWSAGEG